MTELTDTQINGKFIERWAWLPGFVRHKFTPTSVISILLAAFSCGGVAASYRGKFHQAETARVEDHQLLVDQTRAISQLSGQLGKLDTTLNNLNGRIDHLESFRDNLMLDFRDAHEVYIPKVSHRAAKHPP